MLDANLPTQPRLQTRLTQQFGLGTPLVLAPMALASGGALAAACAHSGALALVGGGHGANSLNNHSTLTFVPELADYDAGVKAGDFSRAHATVGEAAGLIHDLPKAADVIDRMTAEAAQTLSKNRFQTNIREPRQL